MTDAWAYSAPRKEKKKRKNLVVGWVGGMFAAGAVAFAIFSQFGNGTITVSTTEPNSAATLTLVGSVSFDQAGESRTIQLQAVPTPDLSGSFNSYSIVGTVAQSGPCAGFLSVEQSGQSRAWYTTAAATTPGALAPGQTRFTAQEITVELDAAADDACSNQASIPLAVRLMLIP